MRFIDVKVGDKVKTDAGFTCLPSMEHLVEEDEEGLFVTCICGRHYLVGQLDPVSGNLIGMSKS